MTRNWETHGKIYLSKCQQLGIQPNERALPKKANEDAENAAQTQGNLNDFVQSSARWSKEGLLKHIINFVVEEDEVHLLHGW